MNEENGIHRSSFIVSTLLHYFVVIECSRQNGRVESSWWNARSPGGLHLERADVDRAVDNSDKTDAALVEFGRVGVIAGVDGGAAGQQFHGKRWPAVVRKSAEQRSDVEDVGQHVATAGTGVRNKIMAQAVNYAVKVRAKLGPVPVKRFLLNTVFRIWKEPPNSSIPPPCRIAAPDGSVAMLEAIVENSTLSVPA